MMSEFKIEHFGISVTDIDRAVKWYNENFGFEETKRFDKPDFEIKGAVMQLGDCILEILQPYTPNPLSPGGNSLITVLRDLGANHIAFSIDDITSVYSRLKENNVEFVTELLDGRFFFCKDPDGTLIEIRQRK